MANYFQTIPNLLYPFEINGVYQLIVLKDIALNVRLKKEILDNVGLYDEYSIENGEKIEHISEKLYGTPLHHWTIMLINQRFDYLNDFPLSEETLSNHIFKKYRLNADEEPQFVSNRQIFSNGELLFWDEHGMPTDPTEWNPETLTFQPRAFVTPVSAIMYETNLNDAKRNIKVINPRLITQVINELEDLFEQFIGDQ
jgi:hypothetical protein